MISSNREGFKLSIELTPETTVRIVGYGFLIFLALTLWILVGCAQKPQTTKVDLEWAFCEVIPAEKPWACIREDDVKELREALIRCQSSKK